MATRGGVGDKGGGGLVEYFWKIDCLFTLTYEFINVHNKEKNIFKSYITVSFFPLFF